ncbi:MAG TPA: ATP-binding cassette domain-containing protein, partial [Rhizomicrobium sp.]|nr:ATP-binding cassette domain-containing protein [Rhizomicrobium sp.]
EIGDSGHWLSGGQSQRIGIARALYGDPRLVVLDEPNSSLDGAGEVALVETLSELKQQGVTVVVVAHRPSVLAKTDKMLVLNPHGGVASFGPTQEVMQQYIPREAPRPVVARPVSSPMTAEEQVS